MRRLGLLLLLLASLSLTTAFAASFEVRAEDIASFSTPVEIIIDTPTTKRLYLVDPAPSRLSETPATQGSSNVHNKSLQPGGVLAVLEPDDDPEDDEETYILAPVTTNTDSATYHDWLSASLGALIVKSPTVELYITQTGNDGVLEAGLFDCGGDPYRCVLVEQGSGEPGSVAGDNNLVVVKFPAFEHDLPDGHRLLLRVVNGDTKAYNIQWGYKENRPARLVLDLLPA